MVAAAGGPHAAQAPIRRNPSQEGEHVKKAGQPIAEGRNPWVSEGSRLCLRRGPWRQKLELSLTRR